MYHRHIALFPYSESKRVRRERVSDMGKRYFVAVHTDSDCLVGCDHKHANVTTATACISQAGGYVVAVRRGKFCQLTEAEEAEFQRVMYSCEERKAKNMFLAAFPRGASVKVSVGLPTAIVS
jgi:hypothetical protein